MSAFYYDSHAFVDDFATGLPDSLAMYGTHIPSLIGRRTGSCLHEVSEGISGKKGGFCVESVKDGFNEQYVYSSQ